jgi:hypothetical protein
MHNAKGPVSIWKQGLLRWFEFLMPNSDEHFLFARVKNSNLEFFNKTL